MLKKMNLPNKLTMLRIALVPLFIIVMSVKIEGLEWLKYVALGIYAIAAFTDFLDGSISRKKGLVTNFGKIMDPLADKLLVSAGFIMLTGLGTIPAYITAIVIFRDFWVSSIRMFGADKKVAIGAVLSGKVKTFLQLAGILLAIIDLPVSAGGGFGAFLFNSIKMNELQLLTNVFMSVCITGALMATIWSIIDYTFKFKKYINVDS
ncbi:MAG: CDP-diacylglycerol--glycerol-3-phosphate 3-phosphatidyltransferase [Clostridia bacterium]|nr:CDP-diacylglycerol--glycerol-3-phosphate 3-phosphatidyltransferase [Clostridia bacterium]MDD4387302.1 CDP-diacylglycerol--glycerol-3-phosphate 3-phosphatidyltransferase [Clostridia bacterium]